MTFEIFGNLKKLRVVKTCRYATKNSKSRVENYLKSGVQSSRLLDMSSSKLS